MSLQPQQRDDIDELFDDLDEDSVLLEKIVKEILDERRERVAPKQIREIAPIEQWLDSEYYLGPDGVYLYDFWKQEIADIYSEPNKYNEIIIDGSIGTGKTTAAEIIMLRELYQLSCYQNIQGLFGLMSKAPIVFFFFSLSKMQAEQTAYGDFRSFVDSIPYFTEEFPRDKRINSLIAWPKEKLLVLYGSRPSHSIGMNMFASVMDEANFMEGEADRQVAEMSFNRASRLYSNSRQRARSRFLRNGVDSSKSCLVSSSTHQTSFTESRKAKSVTDPKVKVITSRLWDVHPEGTYSKEKFQVFIGSDLLEPFIANTVADVTQFTDSVSLPAPLADDTPTAAVAKLPENYKHLFLAVPESFRRDFETDLITALQNIGGASVAPVGKLFTARPVLNKAAKLGADQGCRHPFTRDTLIISTRDTSRIEDFLIPGFYFRDLSKPRFVHIDQSTSTDSTGLSMVHIDKVEIRDGIPVAFIKVDFMLRIDPPKPPAKISITKVRDFLFYMRDKLAIKYGKVTYDWFACLSAGRVVTLNGVKDISCIDTDDYVLTEQGYKRVLRTYSYEDVPVLKLTTSQGRTLEGTSKHKVQVFDKWVWSKEEQASVYTTKWKELGKLSVGDRIVTYATYTEQEELQPTVLVKVPYSGFYKGQRFPVYYDRNFAYLTGYYLGDGSLGDGVNYSFGSALEAERFCQCVRETFGRCPDFHGSGTDWSLHLSSRELQRLFDGIGFNRVKATEKSIPEIVWNSPKEVIAAFVSGLIDSDGNVDKTGRIQISTHSKSVAYQLQTLLCTALGIKATVSTADNMKYKNKSQNIGYVVKTSGERSLNDVFGYSWKVCEADTFGVPGRFTIEKIVAIEPGEATVYDIEVEDTNAYYVNGFYSHNSAESLQILEQQDVECGHQSVDRSDAAYLSFVNIVFEERFYTYGYLPFEEEIFELIHDRARRKVDHLPNGRKDVSDSLVGAINNALEYPLTEVASDEDRFSSFIEVNAEDSDDEIFSLKELMS